MHYLMHEKHVCMGALSFGRGVIEQSDFHGFKLKHHAKATLLYVLARLVCPYNTVYMISSICKPTFALSAPFVTSEMMFQ